MTEVSPDPDQSPTTWAVADIIAFGTFVLITLVFLPAVLVIIAKMFIPELSLTALSPETQILLQIALDIAWVGFIFFLIKAVHRQQILESVRWIHTRHYRVGSLIALGGALALTGILVSTLFPPASAPRIEQFTETSSSLYLLAIFSVCIAPIMEELIFRGFLFNVISDLAGSRLAVLTTALLFALVHAPQLWPSLAGVVLIFVVGTVLSIVRARSNSLIPSFIIHTSYNSMLVGAAALGAVLQKGK